MRKDGTSDKGTVCKTTSDKEKQTIDSVQESKISWSRFKQPCNIGTETHWFLERPFQWITVTIPHIHK